MSKENIIPNNSNNSVNNSTKDKSNKKKKTVITLIVSLVIIIAIVIGFLIKTYAYQFIFVHMFDIIDMSNNNVTYRYYDNKDEEKGYKTYTISDDWFNNMIIQSNVTDSGTSTIIYGPYTWLPAGDYRVHFHLTPGGWVKFTGWDVVTNFGCNGSGERAWDNTSDFSIGDTDTIIKDIVCNGNEYGGDLYYTIHTNGNSADYELRLFFSTDYGNEAPTENPELKRRLFTSLTIESFNANKISFDANGGTLNNKSTGELTSTYWGKDRGNVSVPTRDGYTFMGWYGYSKATNTTSSRSGLKFDTNSDMVKIWDENGKPTGNIIKEVSYNDYTVYAHWTENAYKINFNYNKPSNASNEMQNNQLKEKEVKYNNSIGTLPTPTLFGWAFAGWYTSPNGGNEYDSNTKYLNTGDTTVYAHWTANKYNIVFDANEPSTSKNPVTGNMAAIVCTYDTPVNIPTNSYQIKGWDFVGFNTKADGSGDNIIPGSTVINLTSVNNGVVTLYAQWDAHIEWNASLSKINNDSIDAFDLTNDDKAVNWEHGLGYGKIMHNTLTYTEFGDMQGFLDVEINTVVPTKIKYEFSDTRINSIQLSNDEHTDIGIENGKAVYLHNVSSATSSGYLHKISFNIPDYEAEFDVNKEKEYSAYVDISVSYNVRNTGNEITETRRVYYNLEELDMSKVHSRIRRQPGQANN